jgi:hypothetical protein
MSTRQCNNLAAKYLAFNHSLAAPDFHIRIKKAAGIFALRPAGFKSLNRYARSAAPSRVNTEPSCFSCGVTIEVPVEERRKCCATETELRYD